MRPAALIVCALLLELGWLATWPLSMMLSHSPMFTASLSERLGLPLASAPRLTDSLGASAYVGPATALALLFVAIFAIYVIALIILHAERGHALVLWIVLAATLVFQLTLFAMPGLFSQDVFSYIAYGRATALYGLNPYIWPPSVLQDPSVAWVAEAWRTYTEPLRPAVGECPVAAGASVPEPVDRRPGTGLSRVWPTCCCWSTWRWPGRCSVA